MTQAKLNVAMMLHRIWVSLYLDSTTTITLPVAFEYIFFLTVHINKAQLLAPNLMYNYSCHLQNGILCTRGHQHGVRGQQGAPKDHKSSPQACSKNEN